MKILVADKLAKVGLDWLRENGVDFDVKPGLSAKELSGIVGQYDGMIIRSGVKVTAEVLEKPGVLKGIARAGVGGDNVDVPVATAKGIIGMGRIGRAVARRAEALEMRVLGYDPFYAAPPDEQGVEMVKDLLELCKRIDFLTVHVPKSPATVGMIGRG